MNKFKKSFDRMVRSRNFSPTIVTALIIAAFLISNALIYMVYAYTRSSSSTVEQEDLSISDAAKEVLDEAKSAGKKITVTFCMSEADIQNHDRGSFVYRTAKYFENKYSPNDDFITLRFANIYTFEYDDPVIENGVRQRFDPTAYQKVKRTYASGSNDKEEYDEYVISTSTVIFECDVFGIAGELVKTNTRVVSSLGGAYADFFTLDGSNNITSYNGEEYFTAMLYWVLADAHDVAYFTIGHGENPSANLYTALICAGYYVDELNLRKSNVPDNAGLVVICNPKTDFESSTNDDFPSEIARLADYADKGGNFYVVIDPVAKKLPAIERFAAEEFGISIKADADGNRFMVKDLNNSISVSGFTGFTLAAEYADTELGALIKDKLSEYGENIVVNDTAALNCDESLGASAILQSSSSSGLDVGGRDASAPGPHTLVAYSERENTYNESAKMVFVPSIYLTANDVMVSNRYANKDFMYSIFEVFCDEGTMPYGIDCVAMQEERLEDLTFGTAMLYTSILMAIPVAVAAGGAAIILRRKNR
ncbi:MAG: Gldg family protein [Clostridia bacterium]|nr:Gldg family protein [Clostridia bacterium]